MTDTIDQAPAAVDLDRNAEADREQAVEYLSGFGNGFESEALPGALPIGRNSPQKCAYGLYAEQLSGSPFTAPRMSNERSWLYRIRPTVRHWGRFRKVDAGPVASAPDTEWEVAARPDALGPDPDPRRAADLPHRGPHHHLRRRRLGDGRCSNHVYLITRSMQDEYFYNGDGEMLFVPQQGGLRFCDRVRHHRRRAR